MTTDPFLAAVSDAALWSRSNYTLEAMNLRIYIATAMLGAARGFRLHLLLLVIGLVMGLGTALPAAAQQEFVLGTGDVLRINVFQNPNLTTESRVSESGAINFPLIGAVPARGLSLSDLEKRIAQLLKDGNFVLKPQVNALLVQAISNQVAVLGHVNRPGRYSLEQSGGRLSGVLSAAGGIAPGGSDIVIVTGTRNGKPMRKEIDVVAMFQDAAMEDDLYLAGGDALFINRQPTFYIYGEVQHPGAFRLERGMTVMQTLAAGGGLTPRGTPRGTVAHRRDASGKIKEISIGLDEPVNQDDVIYVKEGIF